MNDYQTGSEASSSGFRWGVVLKYVAIGCGILLFFSLVTCAGVAYFGYRVAKKVVITDPKRLNEIAESIVPGVKPVGHLQPLMGMSALGTKAVFFATVGDDNEGDQSKKVYDKDLTVILVEIPKGANMSPEEALRHFTSRLGKGARKEISREETKLPFGNSQVKATKILYVDGGQHMISYCITMPKGGFPSQPPKPKDKATVVIAFLGSEKGFDHDLMLRFLGNLSPATAAETKSK